MVNIHRKICRLFMLAVVCLLCGMASAQTVTKEFKAEPLKQVFNEIEQQTGLSINYKIEDVNENQKVTKTFRNTPIAKVLSELLDSNLGFTMQNKMILISKKQTKQSNLGPHKQVTGKIVDDKGEPIIGANVLVKGTTNGTITDIDGNYTLNNVPGNAIITISYLGYKNTEIAAHDKSLANVILREDTKLIDEVVVVGYGTQSKARLTGSISRLDGAKLGDIPVASFDQALTARVTGVDISQTNGAPGAGVSIKVRGNSSINYGGHPLIVVDGLPLSNSSYDGTVQGKSTVSNFNNSYTINPLSSINPSDIASIDVLKDAASAAIYGSRGSSGVIIITTNKGKIGKPQVNLNMYAGMQILDKKVDVMDAYELANYTKKARDLAWVAQGGNADDSQEVRKGNIYKYPTYMLPYIKGEKGLTNTDWQDEIYRTAFQQNYDLNVGGGSENFRYYVSGNYMNQDGIIINSGMKRYSSRINIEADLTKRLKFGLSVNASKTDNKLVQSEGAWWQEGIVITALMYHPNLPVYNSDGGLDINTMMNAVRSGQSLANIQNPVALAKMVNNKLENRSFIGNAYFEYKLIDGLKLKTSFGLESMGLHRTFYRPKVLAFKDEAAPTSNYNYSLDGRSSIWNWISETSAVYDKDFGKHNLNALVNFSA